MAIYKPGQGYWTRVMTAVGAGVLVLAGAAWLWAEIEATFAGVLRHPPEDLAKLVYEYNKDAAASERKLDVGPATAAMIEDQFGSNPAGLSLTSPSNQGNLRADLKIAGIDRQNGHILLATALTHDFPADSTLKTSGTDYLLYVQAAVPVTLIAGAALILYWVLNKPSIVEFMISTEAEMRKVNWPNRDVIFGSTIVVIAGTMMLAVMLFAIDLGFAWLFQHVGVLKGS